MPKLKQSDYEMMNREVRAALMAGQERKDMDSSATAKCLGVCKETYLRRNRNPEKFTLADLRILIRVFKFTDEEILKMVKEKP